MMLSFALVASSTLLSAIRPATARQFDPYQLNGGLVAAVAGKGYVLIASDTRLTDGGYGINSRRYLSGRIWSASSSTSLSTFWSTPRTDAVGEAPSSGSSSTTALAWGGLPAQWGADGSLLMPPSDCLHCDPETPRIAPKEPGSEMIPLPASVAAHHRSRARTEPPIMIASAGCASDCESLKRRVRLELDALEFSLPAGSLRVHSVANLLQQILYGRRGFPFYSFCVVAGIEREERDDAGRGSGAVYVYDAIGSYERVAVTCAGTGREMMQPILDHLFAGTTPTADKQMEFELKGGITRDMLAARARMQRKGVAGSLGPPVHTTVDCSWEEAVHKVARAYRSVAEREISVGDEIVICVVNTSQDANNGCPVVDVFSYPLKKH